MATIFCWRPRHQFINKQTIRGVPKNVSLCDCLCLHQILIDFQNSSRDAFCRQLAIKWLLNIPPHINCVATLTCEIWIQEKLAIIDSKLVDKQNTRPTKNAVICTMLDFFRSVSLDIWRIEWYVCFWPLWFSKPTISSTVAKFFSVRVCSSLPVSCLWSVLHVSQISVNNNPTFSLLQLTFKNSTSFLRKLYFWTGTSS